MTEKGAVERWREILGPANALTEREKLKEAVKKAEHLAMVHIGQQRASIDDLPDVKAIAVHHDYESFTILTECGKYIRVAAEESYGSIDLCTESNISIPDALAWGILPTELFDAIKEAEGVMDEYTQLQQQNAKIDGAIEFLEGLGHKVVEP